MTETTREEPMKDATTDGPAQAEARAAVREIEAQGETEAIAIEAEVMSVCLIALGRLPKVRREAVIGFLRERLGTVSTMHMLAHFLAEVNPELTALRAQNKHLTESNARLFQRLKKEES